MLVAVTITFGLFNFGGSAMSLGRLVRLNSLLNASVSIFEIVFSKMFSIREENIGELLKWKNNKNFKLLFYEKYFFL